MQDYFVCVYFFLTQMVLSYFLAPEHRNYFFVISVDPLLQKLFFLAVFVFIINRKKLFLQPLRATASVKLEIHLQLSPTIHTHTHTHTHTYTHFFCKLKFSCGNTEIYELINLLKLNNLFKFVGYTEMRGPQDLKVH